MSTGEVIRGLTSNAWAGTRPARTVSVFWDRIIEIFKLHETAPTDSKKVYGTRLRYPQRVASFPPGSMLRIAANPTSIAS